MNLIEQLLNTSTNYYWGLKSSSKPSADLRRSVKLVAHRGLHENGLAIENSFKAFDLVVENHIWGAEFDVRFTRDNVPVIHHDDNLGRIYKKSHIKISETNFSDLRLEVPDLPALSEMVHRYGKKTKLLIEVKQPPNGALSLDNVLALENTLRLLKPQDDYYLLTLHTELFNDCQFIDKRSVMCVDWMNMDHTMAETLRYGYGAVSGHFMLLNDERLKTCKEKGLITGTGFIETRGALYREINRGIDWIFTNHPLRLQSYLA